MLFFPAPGSSFVSPRISFVFLFVSGFIDSNRGTLDVVLFPPSLDRPRGSTVFFLLRLAPLLHRGSVTCLLSSRSSHREPAAASRERRPPFRNRKHQPPWISPRLRGPAAQRPRRRSSIPWSTGSTTSSCGLSASSSTSSSARCTPGARGRSPSRAPCSSSRRRTPTK